MSSSVRATPALIAVMIASTIGLGAPEPARGVDPTLVAHWTFDEGSGSTVADASGNGHHGTLSGSPTWTTGMIGGALAFDGVDDVMDVLDSATLQPTDLTITMWLRDGTIEPGAQILTKGTADGCASHSYAIRTDRVAASGPADSVAVRLGTMPAVVATYPWNGTWHHVAFRRNGGEWTMTFRDAYLAASSHVVAGIGYDLGANDGLRIGGPHEGCAGETFYSGRIDDVRIYSRALTESELVELIPPVATTTTLQPPPAEIGLDQNLTLKATVSPAPPWTGGSVSFTARRSGTSEVIEIGTRSVAPNGVATLSTSTMPQGSWRIRATFNPTRYMTGSKSAEAPLRVIGLAATVGPIRSTLNPKPTARTAVLRADLSGGEPGDPVSWYRTVDGTEVKFAENTVQYDGKVYVTLPVTTSWATGSHTIRAHYDGGARFMADWSATFVQVVGLRPTATSLGITGPHDADGSTAQQWDVLTLTPSVYDSAMTPTGSFAIRVDGVYKKTIPVGTSTTLPTSTLAPGAHSITAVYSGSVDHATSSVTKPITILANVVDVTNLALGYPTFYPVVDTYRDTVSVAGTRLESASVAITVRNGSGTVVRTYAVPIGSGAYSRSWDGRNGGGILQPAGTYTVTQVLTDSHGATTSWSGSVVLSHQKLVYTTTTLTLNGSAFTASGTAGTGTVTTYSDGSVRFYAPNTSSWAGVGWEFTLPAATVYKSITIGAYGNSGTPRASIGGGNYTLCPTWHTSCFDRSVLLGGSTAWVSSSLSVVDHRSGRVVRMLGETALGGYGKVYKVRCIVTYGVLK